jgi:hypothetical protein
MENNPKRNSNTECVINTAFRIVFHSNLIFFLKKKLQ